MQTERSIGAGRPPGQEVGQVEEMGGGGERLRLVLLQPQNLRRLHFGRDDAADITQDRVPGGVDALRLVERPVIHPDDDVAFGIVGRPDRQRPSLAVENDQRAGGVEAEALDGVGGDSRRLNGLADGFHHRFPDVVGGLLDHVALLPPDADGPLGGGEELSGLIEDPCSCTAGARHPRR